MPLIHHSTQRLNATKQVRDSTKTETHSKRPGVILVIFTQLARHKKKTALLAAAWIKEKSKKDSHNRADVCLTYPFPRE